MPRRRPGGPGARWQVESRSPRATRAALALEGRPEEASLSQITTTILPPGHKGSGLNEIPDQREQQAKNHIAKTEKPNLNSSIRRTLNCLALASLKLVP
jgi:hypothetical protein